NTGHSGTDVERLGTPERRGHLRPLAVGAVTRLAAHGEESQGPQRVALVRRHRRYALPLDLRAHRVTEGEKRHVRDDVTHVAALWIEGPPVHTPLEAVVDPVLDDLRAAGATPVLGEPRVDTDPRHDVLLRAIVGMAAHAVEPVAHV